MNQLLLFLENLFDELLVVRAEFVNVCSVLLLEHLLCLDSYVQRVDWDCLCWSRGSRLLGLPYGWHHLRLTSLTAAGRLNL